MAHWEQETFPDTAPGLEILRVPESLDIYSESINPRPAIHLYTSAPTYPPTGSERKAEHAEIFGQGTVQHSPISFSIAPLRVLDFQGWRGACFMFGMVTTVAFSINLGITIWVLLGGHFDREYHVWRIYPGGCDKAIRWNGLAHIFINGLSTLLLCASNYTMQCLTSPSRTDIDKAHRHRQWLDIGVPSMRNLWRIARMRSALWCLLWISSFPLHFIYNSVIISTIRTYDSSVYLMLNGTTAHNVTTGFEHLTNEKCVESINAPLIIDESGIVFVGSEQLVQKILDSGYGARNISDNHGTVYYLGPLDNWTCYDDNICNATADSNLPNVEMNGADVDHCLIQREDEKCSLQFNLYLMVAVLLANAVKSVSIFWIVLSIREADKPLVTIGDAIFSFLEKPDATTVDVGIVTKDNIGNGIWEQKATEPRHLNGWWPRPVRWIRAASLTRLISCYFLFMCTLCTTITLFIIAFQASGVSIASGTSFFSAGIQAEGARDLNSPTLNFSASLFVCTIIANIPQVIFSLLYFLYNSIFTCMLLGKEWDKFGAQWRPLRVTCPLAHKGPASEARPTEKQAYLSSSLSWTTFLPNLRPGRPTDAQGSSYFLQLPYRYSLPLIAISGLIHWLISQSIFVVWIENVQVPKWLGYTTNEPEVAVSLFIDWSPIGVIATAVISVIIPAAMIGSGLRKYEGNIPLVGSCSAAISAACHPNFPQAAVGVQWREWTGDDGRKYWSLSDRAE